MSKVIQVLAKMASDASLTSKAGVTTMLNDAKITERQKLAIEAKDLDTLTETIHDLPVIKCIPIVPAEDDEDDEAAEKETQKDSEVKAQVAFIVNY